MIAKWDQKLRNSFFTWTEVIDRNIIPSVLSSLFHLLKPQQGILSVDETSQILHVLLYNSLNPTPLPKEHVRMTLKDLTVKQP